MTATLPPIGSEEYFEELHVRCADPFGLLDRRYEKRKRGLVLALLDLRRYRRCFEPGCSVGALTEELAARCDDVLAVDSSAAAVSSARRRTAHLQSVTVERRRMPEEWPESRFDLLVLSELGYYLPPEELKVLCEKAASGLEPGGHLLAVHWRLPIENCVLDGEAVHALLRETGELVPLACYREELFLAELFSKGPTGPLPSPEAG